MNSILIVEDEYILAMLLEKQLSRKGYVISGKAASGEEAVEMVKEKRPDLVLMDIKLNGEMDGIDAVRAFQDDHPCPVIYVTGNSDSAIRERAMQTNPVDYLLKPLEIKDLVRSIEKGLQSQNS